MKYLVLTKKGSGNKWKIYSICDTLEEAQEYMEDFRARYKSSIRFTSAMIMEVKEVGGYSFD